MQATTKITACFLSLFICLAFSARDTAAWTQKTHEQIALMAADYFPPAIRDMIKANEKTYIKGVEAEQELFEKVLKEKSGFSVNLLRYRGTEQYIYHVQRLSFMFDKKSNAAGKVFELGMLARSASDLLEPLPSQEEFQPEETEANRIFFISDFEKHLNKYRFMYDGPTPIGDIAQRADKDIENATLIGGVIYRAYRKGTGYKSIDGDAQAAMNRAINFLTDTVYTLYQNRNNMHGAPFDPARILRLDRFHTNDDQQDMKIPGPKPPAPPKIPGKPETEKKNGKENSKNDMQTGKD
jgi:hypothetical protein